MFDWLHHLLGDTGLTVVNLLVMGWLILWNLNVWRRK